LVLLVFVVSCARHVAVLLTFLTVVQIVVIVLVGKLRGG